MTLLPFRDTHPDVDPSAFVAADATVIGAVRLGAQSSVFYGAVLRADTSTITVGARSNLQDGVVVHADPHFPTVIGNGVTAGHRAVLHGCSVEDDCLIGMGALVLNGATIGAGSLVAAGTVVLGGTTVPPGSLIAGVPGTVRRTLTDDEQARIRRSATRYVELSRAHRDETGPGDDAAAPQG